MSKSKAMKKSQKAKPAKKTAKGKPVSIRGKGKIAPPKRRPRDKKPIVPTFNCSACSSPFTDRKAGGWHGPEGQLTWHCQDCLPRRRKAKEEDGFAWYVMQCEPDKDRLMVKDVRRKLRIESLEHTVKRMLIPTELREKIVYERGEIVERGEGLKDLSEAKIASYNAMLAHAGVAPNERREEDGKGNLPGYKTSCYQDRDTGKWAWHVRKLPDNPQADRKVVPCKKFPGYVLFHMKWTPELDALIRKASKFAWGFLLRPILQDIFLQVNQSKNTGKWMWKLRHPDTREILTDEGGRPYKKKGYETRGAASHAGSLVKAKLESFHPTAVKTREAAELLISQKAVNQIMKDKVELNKVLNAPRVGDTVTLTKPHPFAGTEGVVTKVSKGEKPTAEVLCKWLGMDVPMESPLWQMEVVRRAGKANQNA